MGKTSGIPASRFLPIPLPMTESWRVARPVFAGPRDVRGEPCRPGFAGVTLMRSPISGRAGGTTGNKAKLGVGYAPMYGDLMRRPGSDQRRCPRRWCMSCRGVSPARRHGGRNPPRAFRKKNLRPRIAPRSEGLRFASTRDLRGARPASPAPTSKRPGVPRRASPPRQEPGARLDAPSSPKVDRNGVYKRKQAAAGLTQGHHQRAFGIGDAASQSHKKYTE